MTLKELISATATDKELEKILITCDGAGKNVKQDVLEELIRRARMAGFYDGQESLK